MVDQNTKQDKIQSTSIINESFACCSSGFKFILAR